MNCITIDCFSPTASNEIKNFLFSNLKEEILNNRPIIFICVGSDRTTGDSLGPLVGYKLKKIKYNNIHIYGSLENPIHSLNIHTIVDKIYNSYSNPYIIAIDSALGSVQNIGKIIIDCCALSPGSSLNKDLPTIGDMCIKGVVNISGNMEFLILQNTRLYTVMTLADTISNGIALFCNKIS